MQRLNPQTLVTLWTIEQLGSFSAAARDMGWSQPAISQQIRKCETELGVSLVDRTSHGVELTPAGATFPHGRDPRDRNIRIAPTYPDAASVALAAEGVALSVLVAATEKLLAAP